MLMMLTKWQIAIELFRSYSVLFVHLNWVSYCATAFFREKKNRKRFVPIQSIVDAGLAFVHDLNDNGDCITDADGGNGNFSDV